MDIIDFIAHFILFVAKQQERNTSSNCGIQVTYNILFPTCSSLCVQLCIQLYNH